jgi:hypothetical protein
MGDMFTNAQITTARIILKAKHIAYTPTDMLMLERFMNELGYFWNGVTWVYDLHFYEKEK